MTARNEDSKRSEELVATTNRLLFVYFWQGNDSEAGLRAGFSSVGDGYRCKKDPAVRRLMLLKQEAIALANVPKLLTPADPDDILNTDELKFVCAWRGNATEAARAAGIGAHQAVSLLEVPRVVRAICEKQNMLIAASIKAQFRPVPPLDARPKTSEDATEGSPACSQAKL